MTSFPPGTDVTTRGDLTWSQAISITFFYQTEILYVYLLKARPGEVGPHPAGPFVMGIPQFQLVQTIKTPNVSLARILMKGDE